MAKYIHFPLIIILFLMCQSSKCDFLLAEDLPRSNYYDKLFSLKKISGKEDNKVIDLSTLQNLKPLREKAKNVHVNGLQESFWQKFQDPEVITLLRVLALAGNLIYWLSPTYFPPQVPQNAPSLRTVTPAQLLTLLQFYRTAVAPASGAENMLVAPAA